MPVSADIWSLKPQDIFNNIQTFDAETIFAYLLMAREKVVEQELFDSEQSDSLWRIAFDFLNRNQVITKDENEQLMKAWQPYVDRKGNPKGYKESVLGTLYVLAETNQNSYKLIT